MIVFAVLLWSRGAMIELADMGLKDSFSRFVKGFYAMYTSHKSRQASAP